MFCGFNSLVSMLTNIFFSVQENAVRNNGEKWYSSENSMLRSFRFLSPAVVAKGSIGLVVLLTLVFALNQDVRSPSFLRGELATCGNGVLEQGEVCDTRFQGDQAIPLGCGDGQFCNGSCTECVIPASTCGNGVVDTGEACDPGAAITGCGPYPERCIASCICFTPSSPAQCGNDVREGTEECDGLNIGMCDPALQICQNCQCQNIPTTSCDICTPAACNTCSQSGGQYCIAAAGGATYRCDGPAGKQVGEMICCGGAVAAVCGNGITEGTEECDGTSADCFPDESCRSCQCVQRLICGNGILESGEACDDGNLTGGAEKDGCSPTCTVDSGWTCTGSTPTVCSQTANLLFAASGPSNAAQGANVVYTLSMSNAGPDDAQRVTADFSIPTGMSVVQSGTSPSCVPTGSHITCVGSLNLNQTASVQITLAVSATQTCGSALQSQADLTTTATDPDTTNNQVNFSTLVTCTSSASSVAITTTCGNGTKEGNEACDDGNLIGEVEKDGCSPTCTVDSGWTCTGIALSVCTNNNTQTSSAASSAPAQGVAVVGRFVFYNDSYFDSNTPNASASDDGAIATDKRALLPGQQATFAHYTSYVKGINGIFIDIQNLPLGTTAQQIAQNLASVFRFRMGNSADFSTWQAAPNPSEITIRRGAGTNGSDRISLIWPENVIIKQWLQVIVKTCSSLTALPQDDIFYFGNAVGETGDSATHAFIDGADLAGVQGNLRNFLNPAPITFVYDANRDQLVDGTDIAVARDNVTNFLTDLNLITAGPRVCGNGIADLGEVCDDSNIVASDGCSAGCALEPGWTCTCGAPSVCTRNPGCGDGIKQGNEACDDRNGANGDGCAANCSIESGWTCTGETLSVCTSTAQTGTCGNFILNTGEQCEVGIGCAVGQGCDIQTCQCIELTTLRSGTTACGNFQIEPGEDCENGITLLKQPCIGTSSCDLLTCRCPAGTARHPRGSSRL